MSANKKDLEIVFCLKWKNRPKKEDTDLRMVVVMYDIPSTTMHFEVFKNYLLKNSGTTKEDVNISYTMNNGKEFPIQSQIDFQVALYAFRSKARAGEIIQLQLEPASEKATRKNLRQSNDVETQADQTEPQSIASTCCSLESPPEWFLAGLAQLKKELKEEMTCEVSHIVTNAVAGLKSPFNSPQVAVCPHSNNKGKGKCERKMRKLPAHLGESVIETKDFLKSLKLDNKLEKLERKASKYREKRQALQQFNKPSNDHAAQDWCTFLEERTRMIEEELQMQKPKKMDGKNQKIQTSIPHMIGGETYQHIFEVQNIGDYPWTELTTLQYTWGSKRFTPFEKTIPLPPLQPGEIGSVKVLMSIPEEPGKYECYFQFMHSNHRFGQWLGVEVIVDPKLNSHTIEPLTQELTNQIKEELELYKAGSSRVLQDDEDSDSSSNSELSNKSDYVLVPVPQCFSPNPPETIAEQSTAAAATPESIIDSNNNTENDNNNTESASGSTNCIKLKDEDLENVVVISVPKNEPAMKGYIFLNVDGQKVLIPKNILKNEVAEELERTQLSSSTPVDESFEDCFNKSLTPSTSSTTVMIDLKDDASQPVQEEAAAIDLTTNSGETLDCAQAIGPEANTTADCESPLLSLSHCSTLGSCFSDVNNHIEQQQRMFVFPENYPGYELVHPEAATCRLSTSHQSTVNPFMEAVPNYQQTPVELRTAPKPEPSCPTSEPACANANEFYEEAAQTIRVTPTPSVPQVHILPESLVTGAVNVASSAINTARSVINMIRPQTPGQWETTNSTSPREANLQALADMGFWNRDLNATLLARFNDDLNRVVAELVQ
ncbi:hypothetical protein ABEB36_001699 [Hypothenemus hampei]|uniref:Nbr1 FW domain-containing protein n=1 Tax=Hypothenemus hampei TaxID=57062 RepID=A0ABD1FIY9_HYPHA